MIFETVLVPPALLELLSRFFLRLDVQRVQLAHLTVHLGGVRNLVPFQDLVYYFVLLRPERHSFVVLLIAQLFGLLLEGNDFLGHLLSLILYLVYLLLND